MVATSITLLSSTTAERIADVSAGERVEAASAFARQSEVDVGTAVLVAARSRIAQVACR